MAPASKQLSVPLTSGPQQNPSIPTVKAAVATSIPRVQSTLAPDYQSASFAISMISGPHRKLAILAVSGIALALVIGMVAYVNWGAQSNPSQASVERTISEQLAAKGIASVMVQIDNSWRATVEGTVDTTEAKQDVLTVLGGIQQLASIETQRLQVRRTPSEIALQVQEALQRVAPPVNNLKVVADPQYNITISGFVDSDDARIAVEQAVRAVPGVASLNLQIGLLPSATREERLVPTISPEQLATDARQTLARAKIGFITVRIDDTYTAVLEGTVASAQDKARAVRLIQLVPGVRRVVDRTTLAPPPALSSPPAPSPSVPTPAPVVNETARIEGEINQTLRREGIASVTAQVNDDFTATLKGAVQSRLEKERALQIARRFTQVRSYRDNIFIVE